MNTGNLQCFIPLDLLALLKKELARMIDLIQKWILFPVQIVKILNAFSICYSLL